MTPVKSHDPRIDGKEPVIVRVLDGEDDGLVRFDSWILDAELEWLRCDRRYWKSTFQQAKTETFMPGEGIFLPQWDGSSGTKDEVGQFWKRLVWGRALPVGDEPDPWSFGCGHLDAPGRYEAPREHVRWLRALRFLIRAEATLVAAGTRRTLEDYPFFARTGLRLAIRLMTKDLDCVGNVRFAETGKPGEMRRFNKARASGCCGSTDRYVIVGTKQYIIGCNYGH